MTSSLNVSRLLGGAVICEQSCACDTADPRNPGIGAESSMGYRWASSAGARVLDFRCEGFARTESVDNGRESIVVCKRRHVARW
jgi:hypothetical protein